MITELFQINIILHRIFSQLHMFS